MSHRTLLPLRSPGERPLAFCPWPVPPGLEPRLADDYVRARRLFGLVHDEEQRYFCPSADGWANVINLDKDTLVLVLGRARRRSDLKQRLRQGLGALLVALMGILAVRLVVALPAVPKWSEAITLFSTLTAVIFVLSRPRARDERWLASRALPRRRLSTQQIFQARVQLAERRGLAARGFFCVGLIALAGLQLMAVNGGPLPGNAKLLAWAQLAVAITYALSHLAFSLVVWGVRRPGERHRPPSPRSVAGRGLVLAAAHPPPLGLFLLALAANIGLHRRPERIPHAEPPGIELESQQWTQP